MAPVLFLPKCNSAAGLHFCCHLNFHNCHSELPYIHEMGLVHAEQPSFFSSFVLGAGLHPTTFHTPCSIRFSLRVCRQTNRKRRPLFVAICSACCGIDKPPKGGWGRVFLRGFLQFHIRVAAAALAARN